MYSVATDGYGNMTFSGFCVDILNWMAEFLKIKWIYKFMQKLALITTVIICWIITAGSRTLSLTRYKYNCMDLPKQWLTNYLKT